MRGFLFVIGVLVAQSAAAQTDVTDPSYTPPVPCTYGGAPGVLVNGHCRPTPGGVVSTPAAAATCGPGKVMRVDGAHSYICVPG